MRQNIIKTLLLTTAAITLTACNSESKTEVNLPEKGEIIAVIGDSKITQEDLNNQLIVESGTMTLQKMIIKDVIMKEIPKNKIEEAKSDVELTILSQKSQYQNEDEFNRYLRTIGYDNEDQLRNMLLNDALIRKYSELNLDDEKEDIERAIKDNVFYPKIVAKGILVDNEKIANEVISKLKDGEKWDEIHDEHNLDFNTYNQKGEFPPIHIKDDTMDPYKTPQTVDNTVIEAVKSAKSEGLIDKPVQSSTGQFYVLYVEFNGSMDGWDDHKDLISDQYKSSFLNNNFYITSRIGELLKKYDIKINNKRYEHALSGIYESAGQFEEIVNSPETMFDGNGGVITPDVTIEEVEGETEDKPEEQSEEQSEETSENKESTDGSKEEKSKQEVGSS